MGDTYIKVNDALPEHRKIVAVGGDAGWLHICALAYASRNLTDGLIPAGVVPRLSDRKQAQKLAEKLAEAGLWHAVDHQCPRCPQPGPDEYVIHDYLEHQRSAAEIRRKTAAREPISPDLRRLVYERDEHCCRLCGTREDLTLDHIYPRSLGGPDTADNLQTLCRSCNSCKGARV